MTDNQQIGNDRNTGTAAPLGASGDTWQQMPAKSLGLWIVNRVLEKSDPLLARIEIPCTPNEISDEVSISSEAETPRGRSVGYVGYQHTNNRTVSFSMRIIGELINSPRGDDANGLVSLVNRLKALEYPAYPSAGTVVTPKCYVNMYDGIKFEGICTSVSVTWGGPLVGRRSREGQSEELGTAYAYADVSLSFTQVSDVPFQAIDVAREGNNTGFASMAEKRAALAPPVVEIEGLVIHFVTNFSSIDAQDIGLVRDWASKHKGLVEPGALTVTGHADKTGTSNANIGLSMRRANSLARAIRDNGINIPVTNVSGHSNNEPVSQEDTAIGLAKNRRAEVGVNSPKYVIKSVREGPLHGVK